LAPQNNLYAGQEDRRFEYFVGSGLCNLFTMYNNETVLANIPCRYETLVSFVRFQGAHYST
jgi:hypothetical protein